MKEQRCSPEADFGNLNKRVNTVHVVEELSIM